MFDITLILTYCGLTRESQSPLSSEKMGQWKFTSEICMPSHSSRTYRNISCGQLTHSIVHSDHSPPIASQKSFVPDWKSFVLDRKSIAPDLKENQTQLCDSVCQASSQVQWHPVYLCGRQRCPACGNCGHEICSRACPSSRDEVMGLQPVLPRTQERRGVMGNAGSTSLKTSSS